MKLKILVSTIAILGLMKSPAYSADITNAAASAAMGVYALSMAPNMKKGVEWSKKCSGGWVYCGMAVLAFAQVAQSLKGAKDSGKTVAATDCSGAYCYDNGVDIGGNNNPNTENPGYGTLPGGDNDPLSGGTLPGGNDGLVGGDLDRIERDLNNELDKLADKGYSYDPSKNAVNTPKGSIAASTFGSEAGLKSLGMSDSQIADLAASAKKDLKASRFSGSADLGGGGGKLSAGPGYDTEGEGFDMNKYLQNLKNKKTANRGVAGLEKNFGSDQIGVAQDDIFKMIHRRYQAKKSTLNP